MRTLFAAFALSAFLVSAVPCKWCADHHSTCAACKQTHKNCSTCHNHHNGCKDACNK
ncbi:MAG: hypothetical protein IPP78_09090 [Holophagaceae bacterium]|nr:hypothetical protein [Holophagaceae bacterium]